MQVNKACYEFHYNVFFQLERSTLKSLAARNLHSVFFILNLAIQFKTFVYFIFTFNSKLS